MFQISVAQLNAMDAQPERCPYKCVFETLDEDGRPLSGISLRIKGPNDQINVHQTDASGKVTIPADPGEYFRCVELGDPDHQNFCIVESSLA